MRCEFDPWVGKILWRRKMATRSSIITRKVPWTEETGGLYNPWGHKESEMTEQLSIYTHK